MPSLAETPFLDLLPSSVSGDARFQAAAQALDEQIQALQQALPALLIHSRLDELPEPVVDILGWQFHVDAWNSDWPLEHKRAMVAIAISLHRRMGTPWAVENALAALGLSARVEGWEEYGDGPYWFRVWIQADAEITPELMGSLTRVVDAYKNLRSWLRELCMYYLASGEIMSRAGCVASATGRADMAAEVIAEAAAQKTAVSGLVATGRAECSMETTVLATTPAQALAASGCLAMGRTGCSMNACLSAIAPSRIVSRPGCVATARMECIQTDT